MTGRRSTISLTLNYLNNYNGYTWVMQSNIALRSQKIGQVIELTFPLYVYLYWICIHFKNSWFVVNYFSCHLLHFSFTPWPHTLLLHICTLIPPPTLYIKTYIIHIQGVLLKRLFRIREKVIKNVRKKIVQIILSYLAYGF